MEYLIWKAENLKDKYSKIFFNLNKYYDFDDTLDKNKTKIMNSIIEERIINQQNYKIQWVECFLDKLSKLVNYEVVGATYGIGPSLGGKIIINKEKKKELTFFVSLLSNYYSIQIVEIDKYYITNEYFTNKESLGVKKIIVSPVETEFGELFNTVDKFIRNEIKDSKFLPFKFDMIKIIDFKVNYKFINDYSTVSDGFFNKGLALLKNTQIIGDINYLINEI